MKLKLAMSALAACVLVSGTAMADPQKHNKKQHRGSGSVAVGVTKAGPGGAVAAGGGGSVSTMPGMTQRQTRRTSRNGDRTVMTETVCAPNTVATTSNNASFAGENRASAGSSTSGTASGSGAVASSSDGAAYAARTNNSTEADAYGTSTATARPSRRC